ncbi:MAG TPA: hypothetical protein VMT54_15100 [Candidatus Cybelea sp.]|nr:hypothetical protein [Candidatus Cybelea sp.]
MRAALTLSVMGAALLLASCAGRDPNPEPVDWVFDHYYGCQDIRAEKDRINQQLLARSDEEYAVRRRDDDLMARTIPFLPPGLAAVDETRMSGSAKSPQQVEIEALKARDAHLDSMAADRGC